MTKTKYHHDFNPHSHEGSDHRLHPQTSVSHNFNPHSHEGSDACGGNGKDSSKKFQSTLPRRERPQSWMPTLTYWQISIHTPTKGATINVNCGLIPSGISIHTPTKGATGILISLPIRKAYFNPHSHEGSDPILLSNHLLIYLFQSTLPRRERPSVGELLRTIADFNPHSHEGSDLNKKCITTV